MPLTERQKKNLNEAILEYLRDNEYEQTYNAFLEECDLEESSGSLGLLEKKWTAVVRLTKKVQDLKSRLEETENELKSALPFKYGNNYVNKKEHKATLPNNQLLQLKGHQKAVNIIKFHPNTTWLASGSDDGRIGIWDFEDGKNIKWLKGHSNSINDLSFNNNGTLLCSCSNDTSIRVWNLEDEFRCIKTLNGHSSSVSSVSFIGGSSIISVGRDGTMRLWEIESGYNIKTLQLHDGSWIKSLIVSYDDNVFATCSQDTSVKVWDSKTYDCIGELKGHIHVVECIAFSNINVDKYLSGKLYLSNKLNSINNNNNNIYNNSNSNNEVKSNIDNEIYLNNNNNSSDNDELYIPNYIASGSRDKNIILWDIKKTSIVATLKGHTNWVRSLIFHPSGKYLISSGDDKTIRIWDLKTKREITRMSHVHRGSVYSIDWNISKEYLVSSGSNDIKLWNYINNS